MEQVNCPVCAGTGLIGGNPEKPWEHVGALKTCPNCAGTGKVEAAPEAAPADEVAAADTTVDNAAPAEAQSGGILKRIFG